MSKPNQKVNTATGDLKNKILRTTQNQYLEFRDAALYNFKASSKKKIILYLMTGFSFGK